MTNEQMIAASGSVRSSDPLVCFLYILLRDHLAAGLVEEIVMGAEKVGDNGGSEFCNGWLAEYAVNLAGRSGQ